MSDTEEESQYYHNSDEEEDVMYEPDESDGDAEAGAGAIKGAAGGASSTLPSSKPTLNKQASYDQVGLAEVEVSMNAMIGNVAETLGITTDEATVLLIAHRWNEERLKDTWFDREAHIRASCGVTAGPDPPELPHETTNDTLFFDDVLLIEAPWSETDALPCGHRGTTESWSLLISAAMTNPLTVVETKCIACGSGCKEAVRARMFERYLAPEAYGKYRKCLARSFATANPHVAACPFPGCEQLVMNTDRVAKDVVCASGHPFCFGCGLEAHRPATCQDVGAWKAKTKDEGEVAKWILANTKPCPKCRKPIEKNDGCIHMTCRATAGGCGHEFCWLCAGLWSSHGGYSCNKPPPRDFYDADKSNAAKNDLMRLAFYEERYKNHASSEQMAVNLREKIAAQTVRLLELGMAGTYAEFLDKALDLVIYARRIAKNTYIRAYIMSFSTSRTAELALFEDFQGNLEHHLEQLQEIVHTDKVDRAINDAVASCITSPTGDLMALREQVVHLTSVTYKYISNVLNDMDNRI